MIKMTVTVDNTKCVRCGGCVSVCPKTALLLTNQIICDDKKCINCSTCITFCPVKALSLKK
jgi:ferredoxin